MNKGSIVERLCSDLIAKSRDINGLLYFTLLLYTLYMVSDFAMLPTSTELELSLTEKDR